MEHSWERMSMKAGQKVNVWATSVTWGTWGWKGQLTLAEGLRWKGQEGQDRWGWRAGSLEPTFLDLDPIPAFAWPPDENGPEPAVPHSTCMCNTWMRGPPWHTVGVDGWYICPEDQSWLQQARCLSARWPREAWVSSLIPHPRAVSRGGPELEHERASPGRELRTIW